MFDIRLLHTLSAVIRESGFDRAARVLHITQSAVSQRIRSLEEQTGQALVIRSTPLRATEAGHLLLRHYDQIILLEDALMRDLKADESREPVHISLGVNADSLATWFLEAMESVMREGNIRISLEVDDQDRTHDLLKSGEVLGCVSTRPDPMQGGRSLALGRMRYLPVASPEFIARYFPDGVTGETLRKAPAVTFNRRDALTDEFLRRFFDIAPGEYSTHYIPSSEGFVQLAENGAAYGLIPEIQCCKSLKSGRLKLLRKGSHIDVQLYWHRWSFSSPALTFIEEAILKAASTHLQT